ncbi:hypothetical protein AB0436_25370 [Streptomyces sp. NPDC051322]|uniref:hypothetical protein n=1 Tax=Streptomyces sp. NPDC051322 TaxID=3154645 RepID=UPI00344EABE6
MKVELGDGAAVTVGTDGAGVVLTARPTPSGVGEPVLRCTPGQARELATALLRAAADAERAEPAEPVTVEARELRRGDVRAGDRSMTVDRVRHAGDTTQVTWASGSGRSWTQEYAADTAIGLRRRG